MSYIKIKVDEATAQEIQDFYDAPAIDNPKNPYLLFQASTPDSVKITGYRSKELFTIVFEGQKDKIYDEAFLFVDNPEVQEGPTPTKKEKESHLVDAWLDTGEQLGSDEVGVGDLFGPLVVACCYLKKEDVPLIDQHHILDSKKMTDSRIIEVGPLIESRFCSTVVIASAEKVSALHDQGWNMHKIMANLHNISHQEALKKIGSKRAPTLYIDEFSSEELYFKYLVSPSPKDRIPMHFKTRGESYFPAVAAASVLARYHFLKRWAAMEETLKMTIPKGAGSEADKVLNKLLKSTQKEEAERYIKKFFRNYRNLDERM